MYTTNRVTQRVIAQRSIAGLQGSLSRVDSLQEKLSSGKQISRPSDSPSGTSSALQFRGDIRRNAQWSRNADDGIGWLGTLDNTLQGMNKSLQRASELTLQGMSTGSSSAQAREALASEVDQIRQSLLNDANQSYLGRPVFGGTTTGTTAYNASGTYVGDNQPVMRTVGDGASVRVDVTGPEAFGPAGADLFATLQNISDHLRGDTSQLSADFTQLGTLTKGVQNKLSDVGARYNRVEQSRQAADDRGLSLSNSLSEVENIDLPETIMQLQMANVAYQAALGATSKVIQPSLLDFLR